MIYLCLIILGIWILYSRTFIGKNRFHYIIDDNVRRWGYLYVIPQVSPHPSFYSSKPHPWRHCFLIIMHSLNVWLIYLLFGWKIAALFAFSPLSVNGTAWITGGYYAVTMFFSLTSYYFIVNFQNIFGMLTGSLFFTAALGSTITCIGIPFLFLVVPPMTGLVLFWPLIMYLFGKRFRTGFEIRNSGKDDKITIRKLIVMTKVMAFYIYLTIIPYKLCFFRDFGRKYHDVVAEKEKLESIDWYFLLSCLCIISFITIGIKYSLFGTLWFLITLLPFSQFKVLGQFVAERYLYLPQLGIFIIIANIIGDNNIILAIILTLYVYRTHLYIPAFRKIESLYKNGIQQDPKCVSNYANLGERYLHINQQERARRLLEKGLELDPDSFLCHTNLAAYWISVRGFGQALYHTERGMSGDNVFGKRLLFNQRQELIKELNRKKKRIEDDTILEK